MLRLTDLARRARPMVVVDSPDNVAMLSQAASSAGIRLRVPVEVDIGMHPCGVVPGEPALELARVVASSPGLSFEGLQGYEGHSVDQHIVAQRPQLFDDRPREVLVGIEPRRQSASFASICCSISSRCDRT